MKLIKVKAGLLLGWLALAVNPVLAMEMVGEISAVSISNSTIEIDSSPASVEGTKFDLQEYHVPSATRFIHRDEDDRVTNLLGIEPGSYIRYSVDDPESDQPQIVGNPIIYAYPQE